MQTITFKALTQTDLSLLHTWFQTPHVKLWYARGEDHTFDEVKEKYLPRILDPNLMLNFIIYAAAIPIGFIQLYGLNKFLPDGVADYAHPLFENYQPTDIAGIDLFIADEKYLRKGYATLTLKIFIQEYVQGQFNYLLVDPLKSNKIALSFFEKNGFAHCSQADSNTLNDLMILPVGRAVQSEANKTRFKNC